MKIVQYSLSEVDVVAKQLLQDLKECSIVTLSGSLGAGKTTLTSAILRQLGVYDSVISPTFTYVNKYVADDGRTIFHFDLYRLKNAIEFEQAGFFEYLDQSNSLIFIEWPEVILPLLEQKVYQLKISSIDQQRRQIEIL
ncbi:tRNA (adenosine(37)-N6)-threonylcarbamoyltransferase complex ATPase subunit type 1 TsaE [Candidatus Babeliales bacterium]|nr:tRNA (adenosine(37)-N6)-threonylcarbamoyltransferase complex ATPase subunit type 1 TsaE [Candidatus Babeliales bacterium]